jgi:hypothetical protein
VACGVLIINEVKLLQCAVEFFALTLHCSVLDVKKKVLPLFVRTKKICTIYGGLETSVCTRIRKHFRSSSTVALKETLSSKQ